MASSDPSSNRDGPSNPVTPRKTPAASQDVDASPATPKRPSPTDGAEPYARRRETPKKQEPTLLTDFFMGRQTPARIAAERKRRQSLEAMKTEIRHEMRQEMKQSAVRKLQQPDGVRDRVRTWQKVNLGVPGTGNPDDAATEPSDVAFDGVELESVTEEDRVRIKMRQRRRSAQKAKLEELNRNAPKSSGKSESTQEDNASVVPPKKRVVSDDHWVLPRTRRSPSKKVSPTPTPPDQAKHQLPSNFVSRSSNPSVSSKIKDWAAKVEVVDDPKPRTNRSAKSQDGDSRCEDAKYGVQRGDQGRGAHSRSKSQGNATSRPPPPRSKNFDDGIRVTGSNTSSEVVRDDGIRVRPTVTDPSEVSFAHQTYRPPNQRRKSLSCNSASQVTGKGSDVSQSASEASRETARHVKPGKSNFDDSSKATLQDKSRPDSTTRDHTTKTTRSRSKSYHIDSGKASDLSSYVSNDTSLLSTALNQRSDLGSDLTAKTLADIPGDIPFGHSAFSELDLSAGGTGKSRPKRTKVNRASSLKAVPHVFKKVMEEGKKIIQDMNEPPRQPVANKPPSIEKWLNGTVDPFVDTAAGVLDKKSVVDDSQTVEASEITKPPAQRKASRLTAPIAPTASTSHNDDSAPESTLNDYMANIDKSETPPKEKTSSPKSPTTPTPGGLKRRSATRAPISPIKGSGKREFLGMLKNAFQGESTGYIPPPKAYLSHEQRKFDTKEGSLLDESVLSSSVNSETTLSQDASDVSSQEPDHTTKMASPRFKPPTTGNHELSTIFSEDDGASAVESDLTSDVTQSTITQPTLLTRASEISTTKGSGTGLKRRLTRHSDLVSVLSLPDNTNIPQGIKNNRSRPSLRKSRGNAGDVTGDELLKEFVDDEKFYMRELRTLVDGVIPVLLSHTISGASGGGIFDQSDANVNKSSSKAVVSMGIALEKLKTAHRKAPHSDIRRLIHWAHGVIPTYKSYIDSWRLGFHDVVVNLAPAAPDDKDSVLDALPRNEYGDMVDANGERVAVAHLLKRPLVRIKQLTKLIRCVDSILHLQETSDLLDDFANLQDKARQRNREEVARITDEDASNTDRTRSRDPRTLDAAATSYIDPALQVNAKDTFSLDFSHSNGQRMECQIELIHRDSQGQSESKEDLLIREVGDGNRTYLLFPPLSMSAISARTGDGNNDMVLMIRGHHNGHKWHELLTLSADSEDQILDWLDILPVSPVPPREPEPSVLGDDEVELIARDVPIGVQAVLTERALSPLIGSPRGSPTSIKRKSIAVASNEALKLPQPDAAGAPQPRADLAKRTAQEVYQRRDSHPLKEHMRPELLPLRDEDNSPPSYGEDKAPPPPVHRVLNTAQQPAEKPTSSESQSPDRLKRRTSSPLKHEYLLSDGSSTSGASSPDDSDAESSDDDIESLDIPETELGISIAKEPSSCSAPLVTDSECSLTPSNSASQAGLYGPKLANEENATRYMASISRWSEKGVWKDITMHPCSIVVSAGLIEAFAFRAAGRGRGHSTGVDGVRQDERPLIALDLTPLVLIRQSTALDLEIRSSMQTHSKMYETFSAGNFRFRCHNAPECFGLYMSVHNARLQNQKFIQLENEARFRGFGERKPPREVDADSSGRRRSWFGRKNSYRSSVRAPAHSQDGASTNPSSTPSASSFLKRLTVSGNLSFNLARSSIDRQSQAGSGRYNSNSSSGSTTPRSPSISVENSGHQGSPVDNDHLRIRLHLLVSSAKWEDYGNCSLQIRKPPPGWHQALRANHGLEKRITVTTVPKKAGDQPLIVLDAVLGSGCFSPMGSRGIVCGVWEEVKGADGVVGNVPDKGATGGNIKKWCFQCATVTEASWILRLVHQEVVREA